EIAAVLAEFSCVPVPASVLHEIRQWVGRYGLLRIERRGERFELASEKPDALADVLGHESIRRLVEVDSTGRVWVGELSRGSIKQALIKIGYPVDDRGGY